MEKLRLYLLGTIVFFLILPGQSGLAQDFGYLSGGYGQTVYKNADLDFFVHSFNNVNKANLNSGFSQFTGGSGWGFETAYAYDVEDVLSLIFATELHTYREQQTATFLNGTSRSIGLRIQDLSSTSTIAVRTRTGYFGPIFGTSRRSSELSSSFDGNDLAISIDNDSSLNGTYTGHNYVFEFGAHLLVGHGPLQLQAKLLRPFSTLYSNGQLFDDDIDKSGVSYFPSDYQAFRDGSAGEHNNGIGDSFEGWHIKVSLAITFPT